MNEQAMNVFARIVLEQTQPNKLNDVMAKAHLNTYMETRRSVFHEQKPVDLSDENE